MRMWAIGGKSNSLHGKPPLIVTACVFESKNIQEGSVLQWMFLFQNGDFF
jgi:hypothetical protein